MARKDQPFEAEWPEIAARLRVLLENSRVVAHDADRSLAVLAAEGVRLDQAPLDTAELASILVPALAATDLDTLAEALGVASGDADSQRTVADTLADVFEALLVRIAAYDDVTLERLATHVSEGGWHFAELVRAADRGSLPLQRAPSADAAGDRVLARARQRGCSRADRVAGAAGSSGRA